ncbi:MAG TPA: hypothetical protein VLM37_13475 [Fibrobacteraceae bacterium]|nr:hypothetical protein [Fibrobacteraceae bacterium]
MVETWSLAHLPRLCSQIGERIRWHLLATRNSPEGTRHRILLTQAPHEALVEKGTESVFPEEFALLGAAEHLASQEGGNFVWCATRKSRWLWLVYRDGTLAFWAEEPIPTEKIGAWIETRVPRIQEFLHKDPFLASAEGWKWISSCGSLPLPHYETREMDWSEEGLRQALLELSHWSWTHDLNLLTDLEKRRAETHRELRQLARWGTGSLAFALLIYAFLSGLRIYEEKSLQKLVQITGDLHEIQIRKDNLLDSLGKEANQLEAIGVLAQPRLEPEYWMDALYTCLPKGAWVEQMRLEADPPNGVLWALQADTPGWDAADFFIHHLQALKGVREVRVLSRHLNKNRVQVRLEVLR